MISNNVDTRKPKKKRWFRKPTQFETHGQWWSYRIMQLPLNQLDVHTNHKTDSVEPVGANLDNKFCMFHNSSLCEIVIPWHTTCPSNNNERGIPVNGGKIVHSPFSDARSGPNSDLTLLTIKSRMFFPSFETLLPTSLSREPLSPSFVSSDSMTPVDIDTLLSRSWLCFRKRLTTSSCYM